MKIRKFWIPGLLIIIGLLAWNGRAQSTKTQRTWEYKIVSRSDVSEMDLDKMGAEGWELVEFDSGVRGGGFWGSERYILKRAK